MVGVLLFKKVKDASLIYVTMRENQLEMLNLNIY